MKAILTVVSTLLLLVVPSGVRYAFVTQGDLVSAYALQSGGIAIVTIAEIGQMHGEPNPYYYLRLGYVPDDGDGSAIVESVRVWSCPVVTKIITRAYCENIHIVVECSDTAPTVHHYRWTLPDGEQVAGDDYHIFIPVVTTD